jgi:uncharacterized protein (TIGR00369 family)
MKLAVSADELQGLLASVAFTRVYGFTIASIGDGECTISIPFQELFERPGGIVNGAVFMAAADVAMWLAIKTQLGLADASVTAEMKTSFLSGAKKEDFRCMARVLKCGRRLIYGVAECTNSRGELLTHHTLTYIRQHGSP